MVNCHIFKFLEDKAKYTKVHIFRYISNTIRKRHYPKKCVNVKLLFDTILKTAKPL